VICRGGTGEDWNSMTEQAKAPAGAPNVLLIRLDGIGFGQASASGGPVATPQVEALIASGSAYNRFHSAAQSWSDQAALLTGRNHHRVEARATAREATGFAEYDLLLPCSVVSVGTVMGSNGYRTAWFGESHDLAEDLVDRAREWIVEHRSQNSGKPFFAYLTADVQRAPHHALQPYIERYKGAFDKGWDAVRRETLDRQKAVGLVPGDTELSADPENVPGWDRLSDDERLRFAQLQEIYAGSVTYADEQIGRLVSVLDELRIRRNTLVILIAGESSRSAQSPWAGQAAYHSGGTRRLAAMSWPRRIPAGGQRAQFHHAIDIMPTILDAAKITASGSVDGIEQLPVDGVSMDYTWQAAHSPGRRTTQYFEHEGDRAIYHNGWFASARHGLPWELYDLTADVCRTNDLADAYPDKVRQLSELFDEEARADNVHA
jgi:arylsulfatase A-like enzyme